MVSGSSPSGVSACFAAATNCSVVMSVRGRGNWLVSNCRAAFSSDAKSGLAARSSLARTGLT